MVRRVKRPKDKSELLNQLTDTTNGGVFDTYKDALIFSAALGAFYKKKKPFSKTDEQIDYNVFITRIDTAAFINALSLAETEDITVLSDYKLEEKLTILEQYANGGLIILEKKMKAGTPIIDIIIGFINEARESIGEEKDTEVLKKVLEGIGIDFTEITQ